MAWTDLLLPASWRGVPFRVDVRGFATGRRTVTHEFAKRDEPYSEDMGRKARRVVIQGWLIGDDYIDQWEQLIQALEQEGPGTLVHPSLGEMLMNLDGEAIFQERRERGRMVEVEMRFVEAGNQDGLGTDPTADTTSGVTTAASAATTTTTDQVNTDTGTYFNRAHQ